MARAVRKDGSEVLPGDWLVDFRGDGATFISASPSRGEGKVTVRRSDGYTATYYPSVFDLPPITE